MTSIRIVAVVAFASVCGHAAVVNFDNLAAGTAVDTQYASAGVRFVGTFRVFNLDFGGAVIFPSPPNSVHLESSTGSIIFVAPSNPSLRAVTNSVSFINNGLNPTGQYSGMIVTARDINGVVLGTVRIEPVGPNQARANTPTSFAIEGIHEIDFTVIPNPPGAGLVPFDDLTFNTPTAAAPAATILPQFAFGGGWYSALYFTNTSASGVSFPISFVADDGKPLSVQAVGGSGTNVSIPARGTAIVEAPNVGPLSQGYALLSLPGGVVGYGIFRQSVPGRGDQEAVVPISGTSSKASTLIWDDTNFITAVAIVNLSSLDTTVTITVRDSQGSTIGTSTIAMAAKSKLAVALRDLPGLGGVAGKRGAADFTATIGNIAVLGLRFGGSAFTSIPVADR